MDRETDRDTVTWTATRSDGSTVRCELPLNEAAEYMDDELREHLHGELAPCEAQDFLDRDLEDHRAKYGEDFVVN